MIIVKTTAMPQILYQSFCFLLITINMRKIAVGQVLNVVSEGTPCEIPRNNYGTCGKIKQCPSLLNLLITQSKNAEVVKYLRSTLCGYLDGMPIVCCPDIVNQVQTTTERNKPTQTISNQLPQINECGRTNVTTTRVVNGIPAKLGEFPWIAALAYRNPKNVNQPRWLCGGTLITDRHILTAAHCVHNRKDLYAVRLGDLNLYSDDDGATISTIPVLSVKIHEQYSTQTYINDIAILTLREAHNNPTVRPICLPVNELLRTKNYTALQGLVVGWGALYFRGPSSPILQLAALPIVAIEKCARAYQNASATIDERVLCAGYLQGGTDACSGDSGGPLMTAQRIGREFAFYQIGIVSYGFRCAQAGYPGVYTRVTAYLDWIQRNLQ